MSYRFTNYYRCPCGAVWHDCWDAQCNDRCPSCRREIEPYASEDAEGEEDFSLEDESSVTPV